MAEAALINRLAELVHIQSDYIDAWGNPQEVTFESKRKLLAAMGFEVDNSEAVAALVTELENRPWTRLVPAVKVVREGSQAVISLSVPDSLSDRHFAWDLATEEGQLHSGIVVPAELEEDGSQQLGDTLYRRYLLEIDATPAMGYHRISVRERTTSEAETPYSGFCRYIVVPERCYQPEAIASGNRIWGSAVQLYTLRSDSNWGIGDFTDLARFSKDAAHSGINLVGLNPLHAMFPHNAHAYSPYSPSSRLFLNVIYIDPQAVPEYAECDQAQNLVESEGFQENLSKLRNAEYVDYPAVAHAKRQVVEKLFVTFNQNHLKKNTARAEAFFAYTDSLGQELYRHALYEALQEHFFNQDWSYWGWPVWPEEYRDPEGDKVREFAAENAERVQFFQYLQWLCDVQLTEANQIAQENGMAIGLYRDLAVGIDRAGAEAWSNQSLYTNDANIGAPPDQLCTQGQDWGLPATVPSVLEDTGYDAFIKLIQANMRGSGALRIDHVLGMLRLWWVPLPGSSTEGAYCYYALDDLLGILALESQRNQCMVIGEDLGTVPQEIQDGMQRVGVFSYRVFFFERNDDGTFLSPDDYPQEALATVSTHDLPTLVGYWQGRDIDVRDELGMFPSEELKNEQYRSREADRRMILQALDSRGISYGELQYDEHGKPVMTDELRTAIQVYVAQTRSKLMMVQVEDILGQMDQVNLPGTDREYPNWQRKLTAKVDDIFNRDAVKRLAQALTDARQ